METTEQAVLAEIEQLEKRLTILRDFLSALTGNQPSKSRSHMSAIDAVVLYIKDKGGSVERETLVRDLANEGVCWDSKSRGGAQADIERSISRFLKYGRRKGERAVLRAKGSTISLSEWKD